MGVTGSYSDPYIEVAITSDNPSVNDVFYAPNGYPSVMLDYGGRIWVQELELFW